MRLDDELTVLKGVGPELAKKFTGLGISTLGQLIDYLPRRYEDYSEVVAIRSTKPGPVTIKAVVKQTSGRYVRRGMHITEAVVSDSSGSMRIIWFNQPYRESSLKKGGEYYFSGTYELSHQRLQLMSPSAELVSEFPVNTARIIPIYRETKGLNSKQIRKILSQCVTSMANLTETLPSWLIKEYHLISLGTAYRAMHFPRNSQELTAAKKRLGFEEVFELSLAGLMNKREFAEETSIAVTFNEKLAKEFVSHLPFKLTDAQRKVVWQIYQDMRAPHPMNRLVEGDVGSGKTVVATMAALMPLSDGYQVAFMAPTELLARQHAETIYKLLKPLGRSDAVTLLVGSLSAAQKKQAHATISAGKAGLIVGTNAIIQEKVRMEKLGMVIVDEQHRFGVEQRKELMRKAGYMPHLLSLTATPIPRTLALTLYGELQVSLLDIKPAGRKPIKTTIVSPNSRTQLYEALRAEINAGRQIFVICPLIQESNVLDVNSAEKIYEQFSKHDFKEYRVGLLHGKLKSEEKNSVMQRFVDHQLDILVSTTVIEVGVDVPNASVMLLEAAERFGLAQIHQLRGRVGRGEHQGYCYLMLSDSAAPSRRLRALESSNDGFKLAELDLELRGPGAIYGHMQHGALDLRIAKLTDVRLIAAARQAAMQFLVRDENLLQYNQLHAHVTRLRAVTNLN